MEKIEDGQPRRRRKPREDTVRIAGRSVTRYCATVIAKVAKKRHLSPTAVIVEVLEDWAKRLPRRKRRATGRERTLPANPSRHSGRPSSEGPGKQTF